MHRLIVATGLPVPTIAVATDGGTSIIKNDGTVIDITPYSDDYVAFDKNNLIIGRGDMFLNRVCRTNANFLE